MTDSFEHRVEVSAFARDQSTRRSTDAVRQKKKKKKKKRSDRPTFFPNLQEFTSDRVSFFFSFSFLFLRNRVCLPSFQSTSVILFVPIVPIVKKKKKKKKKKKNRNSPHETLASVSCKVSKVFTLYIVCIVTLVIHTNDTLALVHNYAYNHNVPEGIGAWRDLITYAILCTQIKQRGRRVGGISEGWR